jgi:hypothetical protein
MNGYNYLRYDRTTIRGDLTHRGNAVSLLLILEKNGRVSTREWPISIADSGFSDLHNAVLGVMAETYPELAGRMYLRDAAYDQAKLADAGKIFAKWISVEPLNERPYYYLIAVYENLRPLCITDEQGVCVVPRYEANPGLIISWAKEVESINDVCRGLFARTNCAIRSKIASAQASSTSSLHAMIEATEANGLLFGGDPANATQEFQDIESAYPGDVTAKLNLSVAQ